MGGQTEITPEEEAEINVLVGETTKDLDPADYASALRFEEKVAADPVYNKYKNYNTDKRWEEQKFKVWVRENGGSKMSIDRLFWVKLQDVVGDKIKDKFVGDEKELYKN